MRASAHRTGLGAATVDAVFSSNALQHVHPLAELFAEVHRVLRPGGWAYFHFGPVWSAPAGSHVEGFRFAGRRYDFWTDSLVPPWAHLVLSAGELADLLAVPYGKPFARALSEWIHTSPWLNRVPLHRLLAAVSRSPMRLLTVRGTPDYGYAYRPPDIDHPLAGRLRRDNVVAEASVRHGIPAEHLDVRAVELVLRRPVHTDHPTASREGDARDDR